MAIYNDNTKPVYTSDGLPLNIVAVQQNITNFLSEYSLIDQHENHFIKERVNELKGLYDIARTAEEQFFKDFEITKGSLRESLKEFQERLDDVFINSGINQLIGQNFYKTFMSDINISNAIEHSTVQATKELIQSHSDYLFRDMGEITTKLGVIDELNNRLDKIKLNDEKSAIVAKISVKNNKRASHFARTDKIGLLRYVVRTKINDQMQWAIDFSQDQGDNFQLGYLDVGVKNKILALLKNEINIENLNNQYSFRNYVNNIIRNKINVNLLPYIEAELHNVEGYTLNKNENTLKGYVEEVCMNAAFSYLAQNNDHAKDILKRTIPTGSIRDLSTKQQIPIDMLLHNYGFQIKSWDLKDDKHEELGKMGAGNFIVNNLQLDQFSTLVKIFGTYHFNQWYSEGFDEMEGYLQDIMDPETGPMNNIFNAYLDRIIRLNRTFSADLDGLTKKQMYSNTFYLVNGKLVPGSEIILAMITAFQNAEYDSSIVAIKIDDFDNKFENSLPDLISKHTRSLKRGYSKSIFSMANLVKIKYKIIFDVGKLIDNAYKQINKS